MALKPRATPTRGSGLRVALCLAAALGAATGCQRALFPSNTPRTQYETYDRVRARYVPLEEPDVFGNPQPALRARLTQD